MNVAIVGLGAVGETAAHTLVLTDTAARLVLVNRTIEKATAIGADLKQARPWGRALTVEPRERSAPEILSECALVVTTLGPRLQKGQERKDKFADARVAYEKAGLPDTLKALVERGDPPIVLVVTNPVEPMVTWLQRATGYPAERLIGLGCTVESARLAAHEGDRRRVAPRDVGLHVVGEHGPIIAVVRPDGTVTEDAEVQGSLDQVRVDAETIRSFSEAIGAQQTHKLLDGLRSEVGTLPQPVETWLAKELPSQLAPPATRFAIASCVAAVARAIRDDERRILAVSAVPERFDTGLPPVAVALPYVVGRGGIIDCIVPKPMPRPVHEAAEAIRALVEGG